MVLLIQVHKSDVLILRIIQAMLNYFLYSITILVTGIFLRKKSYMTKDRSPFYILYGFFPMSS